MSTLKRLAAQLESVAIRYAKTDPEAKLFFDSLENIIQRVKKGEVLSKDENIPGQYWFSEGELRKYRDLEDAYSEFSIFVAAGSDEKYAEIMTKVGNILK